MSLDSLVIISVETSIRGIGKKILAWWAILFYSRLFRCIAFCLFCPSLINHHFAKYRCLDRLMAASEMVESCLQIIQCWQRKYTRNAKRFRIWEPQRWLPYPNRQTKNKDQLTGYLSYLPSTYWKKEEKTVGMRYSILFGKTNDSCKL